MARPFARHNQSTGLAASGLSPRGGWRPVNAAPGGPKPPVLIPASGTAHAELGLSLNGFQPTTISASGESGRVLVKEKLRPAAPPAKKKSAATAPSKKAGATTSSAKLSDDDDYVAKPPPPGDLKKPAP